MEGISKVLVMEVLSVFLLFSFYTFNVKIDKDQYVLSSKDCCKVTITNKSFIGENL